MKVKIIDYDDSFCTKIVELSSDSIQAFSFDGGRLYINDHPVISVSNDFSVEIIKEQNE